MIPVFLSYPRPFLQVQQDFIDYITGYLATRCLEPRTLGVTDYGVTEPLVTIRRLMLECNGLLCIAFRRAYIEKGTGKPGADLPGQTPYDISNTWLTSPYMQIEPAMAFQLGLPSLIFRENGVFPDGMLEKGVADLYIPTPFDLSKPIADYFASEEWRQTIDEWEGYVRAVYINRGYPPKLY